MFTLLLLRALELVAMAELFGPDALVKLASASDWFNKEFCLLWCYKNDFLELC